MVGGDVFLRRGVLRAPPPPPPPPRVNEALSDCVPAPVADFLILAGVLFASLARGGSEDCRDLV